ncbi:uncharacterized protein ColSpa_09064 [Colletotrichum spaethianum]|uniref:Uncharacterized protein n=1 Tax=Colletotrichum spaethianum TaxID=700344 RepID=A0AA37PAX5_9PEZI|nr:uncharacterized protein ColSpa_09064 [Colletotrichum spaethianum]GKT48883.1 hypothetical protein ColSpa_09064 [Colletotrichum spaethianum]
MTNGHPSFTQAACDSTGPVAPSNRGSIVTAPTTQPSATQPSSRKPRIESGSEAPRLLGDDNTADGTDVVNVSGLTGEAALANAEDDHELAVGRDACLPVARGMMPFSSKTRWLVGMQRASLQGQHQRGSRGKSEG